LRENGFEEVIRDIHGKVPIFGICGGYQILCKRVIDVNSIESETKDVEGLGLLNGVTYFDDYKKTTKQVEGHLNTDPLKRRIRGYEIHMGRTENKSDPPLNRVRVDGRNRDDGAYDQDKMVFGTYLHGFFDLPPARELLMSLMDPEVRPIIESKEDEGEIGALVERNLDHLASVVRSSIDIDEIKEIIGVD